MDGTREERAEPTAPSFRPLAAVERRLVGVLVEKAKTTPEQYPLTVAALRAGANQKNNRFPPMQLELDEVEEALEGLRQMGAVVEVQGSSRVCRYRHMLYDWLGVNKAELAVMAELLLRGEQTVGELRGRAARMEPIADLAALRPHLTALVDRKLVLYLTAEGRGAVVTHTLYQPEELARLRATHAHPRAAVEQLPAPKVVGAAPVPVEPASEADVGAPHLASEVRALRRDVDALRADLDDLMQ